MRIATLFFGLLTIASCTPELPEGVFVCTQDAECPSGWSCDRVASRCMSEVVGTDAGCPTGSAPSGSGCVDVDECTDANICGPNGTCMNLVPGFSCTCGSGYEAAPGSEPGCVDVAECANGADDCDWLGVCAETSGSFGCTCPTGYVEQQHACASTCAPAADVDTGMLHWVVEDFLIDPAGFDLDGWNNAQRGGAGGGTGKTIAGCNATDRAYGVDNGLAGVATSLSALIDLNAAFHDMVAVDGSLAIALDVAKLAPSGADDPCVTVTLTMDGDTTQGLGAVTDHVLTVDFADPISFGAPFTLGPGSCTGTCNPGELRFTVRGARARLELNASHTALLHGSLGGYVFYEDTTGGYESENPNGIRAALVAYAAQTNWSVNERDTFDAAFSGARDLRMTTGGTLTDCTAPGGNASLVNRNAVSASWLLAAP